MAFALKGAKFDLGKLAHTARFFKQAGSQFAHRASCPPGGGFKPFGGFVRQAHRNRLRHCTPPFRVYTNCLKKASGKALSLPLSVRNWPLSGTRAELPEDVQIRLLPAAL